VFPTTIWTTIQQAGARNTVALADVAERYRQPVLEFIRRRGYQGADAEDLCQDVFLRVLKGGVLAKADRDRGRFRSLLLSVTVHVIQDRLRKRREMPVEDLEPPQRENEFDEGWALHLTERAIEQLREQGSPYYDVLEGHLAGRRQDRNKLWIARRKLATLIRQEVAYTCATRADFETELAYLAQYLRPAKRMRPRPGSGEE
jgi:RNA polymerase sigma factor (sigma-70 family)